MGSSIFHHNDLLIRYLIVFLIGYVLFAIHAGADTRKTNISDPVLQIEPGKAKLVDLAQCRGGQVSVRSSRMRSKAAHAPAQASAISAGVRTPARSACMKVRQRGPGPAASPFR